MLLSVTCRQEMHYVYFMNLRRSLSQSLHRICLVLYTVSDRQKYTVDTLNIAQAALARTNVGLL